MSYAVTAALSAGASAPALTAAIAEHANYQAARDEAASRRTRADLAIYQAWRECHNPRAIAATIGARPETVRRAISRVAPPSDAEQLDIYTALDDEEPHP